MIKSHVHRHVILDTWTYVWHDHGHSCPSGPLEDFNVLHHHTPTEHEGEIDERQVQHNRTDLG